MDNDMLPNDGELFNAFQEPEEQATERRVEISKAQAAKPMLEDLIRRANERIAVLSSADAIYVAADSDPEAYMRAHFGVQERLAEVRDELTYLESLLSTTRR